MRDQRTEAQGAKDKNVDAPPAIEAGEEAKTNFHAQGTIPPVGSAEPPAPAASASDLAFGDTTGGGGRAAAGAAAGGGGGGQPLPDDLRTKFEASLGVDLSGVRIHTDGAADAQTKAHGAKATATGQDIHMAPGKYDPHSREGQELLAHEVAHTVQQKHATPMTQAKNAEAVPATSSGAEREADGAAAAMVGGKQATVTPVAEQAPHAKAGDYNDQVKQYQHALDTSNWSDAALRLNGFSDDDIKVFVHAMAPGRRAHVYEAAEVVMPGWAQRVTGPIKHEDEGATDIAALYAAYEKAVTASRTSGDWTEVANRLNGMGDWDISDRLKKLTWPDFQGIRKSNATPRVLTAVDAADAARARSVFTAYDRAIHSGDLSGACNQLNGMSDEDIQTRLRAAEFTQLTALKPYANPRVATMIDAEIKGRPKAEQAPDGTEPTKVDGLVDVEAPLVALPDFADDTRTTQEAHDAGGEWAGSAKLQAFVEGLAKGYAEKAADQQIAKSKKPTDRDTLVESIRVDTLTKLHNQWHRVINEYAIVSHMDQGRPWVKFAVVARYWCSDVSQGRLFALHALPDYKLDMAPNQLIDDEATRAAALQPMIKGGSYPVRPIVNDFMRNYTHSPQPSYWYNYSTHGGGKLYQQGFSVDLMFDGATTAGRNDEGFVPREAALQVIHNIAYTAASVGGDWQVCYNDFSVAEAASKIYGGRVSYVGVNSGKDDPSKGNANANGHGTHAPLNLHFHLDIVPKTGATPLGAGGADGGAAKAGDEKVPSPVGIKPPVETH